MNRQAILVSCLLAGCSTVPTQPAPPDLAAPPGGTSIMCTLVSTFTTTVRTVLLQVGADAPAGTVETGGDCSIKVTRK
jgi:hypothetical protein